MHAMNSTTTVINLFISFATLLWGDPMDCLDPTDVGDESCSGGLASVASVIRQSRSQTPGNENALYIPKLDRVSKFVQMHPLGWGVNELISRQRFGWEAYFTSPSLFSEAKGRDLSNLRTHDFSPVLTNLDLPPTSPWSEYINNLYFDHATGAAVVHIRDETQPLAAPAVESLVATLDYIAALNTKSGCFQNNNIFDGQAKEEAEEVHSNVRCPDRTSRCWSAVVLFNESNEMQYAACLKAALAHPHPPIAFFDVDGNDEEYLSPKIVNDGTVVFHHADSTDSLLHLHLEAGRYDADGRRSITDTTFSKFDLNDLPPEMIDDEYVEDKKYLRELANRATQNDPVVGMSGRMTLTRVDNWRMCMGGECPIGNLFTDALRWASDADFAVMASGGLRGPGWDAGPVHVGDLWTALPFLNFLCTGVMSGVSVYRLLNYSTAVAEFQSTYTPMGDRLLQMSGMRMTYNTLVNASEGSGRLMSVEIWDRDAQKYLPLERLKLYKFATENWLCGGFDPYPSLLGSELRIKGEVPGVVDKNMNVQGIVGEYLSSIDGVYDTSIQGRLVNDTSAFEALDFIQTPESCLIDYFWDSSLYTCMQCPGGKHVKFSDEMISFFISNESNDFGGRNVLYNRETFDVTVAPNHAPSWVVFGNATKDSIGGSMVLQPGESVAIEFTVDVSVLSRGSTRSTVSYGVVVDGDFPGCLTDLDITFDVLVELRAEENFNQIDTIRPVGLFLMSLAMLLSISLSVLTFRKRSHRVIRAGQPPFLILICFGTFVMASSIIALSIDDSIASQEGCSKACMAFPWLFTMGFSITWSSLLAKISRLNKVMSSGSAMRRVVVKEQEASLPIIVFFLINFILLLCWTLMDPLKWQREPITENDPTNTYGFCLSEGKASIAFLTLLVCTNLMALVLACVQAYRARRMDDQLTESRWVGFACASWIQVLVIGIPVILLTREQPIASYFTQTALVFLVCTSMLVLIFLPKMLLMRDTSPRPFSTRVSRGGTILSRRSSVARVTNMQEAYLAKELQYQSRICKLERSLEEALAAKSLSEKKSERPEKKISFEECKDIEEPTPTSKGNCTLSDDLLNDVALEDTAGTHNSSVESMEAGHKVVLVGEF